MFVRNAFNVLVRWLVARRRLALVGVYLTIFTLCYQVAFQLRFDFSLPDPEWEMFWKSLPWLLAVKLFIFHRFGSFHGWWRFVTFADLVALLGVATVSMTAIAAIDYVLIPQYQLPRSVILLDWATTVLIVGGLRSSWRLVKEHVVPALALDMRETVLVIGTVQGCESLARQVHNHPSLNYRVVGFLHEDSTVHGSRLGGIPFLGKPEHGAVLAIEHGINVILVISDAISGTQLRAIRAQCSQANIELKMVPPVDELLNNSYRLRLRDVNINDLLRREPVELDTENITEMLRGRRVMVTGAGGSIGSEICRQVVQHPLKSLILVERAENNLFHIEQELLQRNSRFPVIPRLADICDARRMRAVFEECRPDIVFHAAAHKHVPLLESNPGEAIKNNILGTKQLGNLAHEFGVKRFVMISTDKAVNPTSIMGMSKQLAERFIHAYSEVSETNFVVVRFGNVLASAGSVIPTFQRQIEAGGPITVTHPEMRRYFMTIPEASQLVLQAAAMGCGGEIFVLDMGEPVKIIDLAHFLIELSGLKPDDIEIQITGIRPGEKLFEELYLDAEETLETMHPKLRVAYHTPFELSEVLKVFGELEAHVDSPEDVVEEVIKSALGDEPTPTIHESGSVSLAVSEEDLENANAGR